MYNKGDLVQCLYDPFYWDTIDNENNPEGVDEEDLLPENEHPGFNDEMNSMLGNWYEIKDEHPHKPWILLKDEDGQLWWWHTDWLSKPKENIKLSQVDESSKYKHVILKIKKMQASRERKGYVF